MITDRKNNPEFLALSFALLELLRFHFRSLHVETYTRGLKEDLQMFSFVIFVNFEVEYLWKGLFTNLIDKSTNCISLLCECSLLVFGRNQI